MKTVDEWIASLRSENLHPSDCVCDRCKHGVECFILPSDITKIRNEMKQDIKVKIQALLDILCD